MSASKLFSRLLLAASVALPVFAIPVSGSSLIGVNEAKAQSHLKRFGSRTGRTSTRIDSRNLIVRRDQIEDRNRRVAVENQLQFERRQETVFDSPRQVVERNFLRNRNVGFENSEAVGGGTGLVNSCPVGFNCGYRIYKDGSGPRIITPGFGGQDGAPQFDGIQGPAIITLQ